MNDDRQSNACRETALSLLDRRPHGHDELRRKLAQREFSPADIEAVLTDLTRLGLLDDLAYAKACCAERSQGTRALGRTRLGLELRRRGLAAGVVEEALDAVAGEADGEEEFARALDVGRRKWRSIRPRTELRQAQARLYRFLQSRGFAAGTCHRVLESLAREKGESAPDPE